MTGILRGPRRVALALIAMVMAAASLVALAQSYRGLYDWARGHGLPGIWAGLWPLQVDTFLVVGELSLFVALVDRWSTRARLPAWLVTLTGLVVSVAGNVGHVHSHDLLVRATAAVPPLAAAFALAVGLGVLKRVVEAHHRSAPAETPELRREIVPGGVPALNGRARSGRPTPGTREKRPRARSANRAPVTPESAELTFAAALAEGRVPSLREVRRELHVGTDKARQLRAHLEQVSARTA